MTLFSTGQPGQHPHKVRGLDLYSTPRIAVEALLGIVDDFDPGVTKFWEFAAGDGPIVRVLRAYGYPVIASDIVARKFPLHFTADFLSLTEAPAGCNVALTNPPFQWGRQFAEHALTLVPNVYFLLRLAFYESVRRTELLEHGGLRRVFVFRTRLPRMHREGWTGNRTSSSVCFAWFHWQRGYRGPTTLHRI